MRGRWAIILAVLAVTSCGAPVAPSSGPGDVVSLSVARGRRVVEAFFGQPLRPFAQRTFASHAELAAFAAARWKMTDLPCWAVGIGTGSTLAVLDPAVWRTEACEHDPVRELDTLVAHELVHVFHGQHRPEDPELDRAEEVGWFAEGLAVLASGQLDAGRRERARAAVAGGQGPQQLADVWAGNARYATAGTLVELVEHRLGRARLISLLPASTNGELLAALGMTEAELIAAWRASLAGT